MGSLTGVYTIVLESQFDNDFRGTDMGPLHRYAQPGVAGAPTPRSHQHVIGTGIEEFAVDALHVYSDGGIVDRGEMVVHLHIDHIRHLLTDTMAQRIPGTQQATPIGNLGQILIQHLLAVDDGTNLEEIEIARTVFVEIAGKLYFHGTAHLHGTKLL